MTKHLRACNDQPFVLHYIFVVSASKMMVEGGDCWLFVEQSSKLYFLWGIQCISQFEYDTLVFSPKICIDFTMSQYIRYPAPDDLKEIVISRNIYSKDPYVVLHLLMSAVLYCTTVLYCTVVCCIVHVHTAPSLIRFPPFLCFPRLLHVLRSFPPHYLISVIYNLT